MVLAGAYQCQVTIPQPNEHPSVGRWQLPVYILGRYSPSVARGLGYSDTASVGVNEWTAYKMGLTVGSALELQIGLWTIRVTVDSITNSVMLADIVVNGALDLGMFQQEEIGFEKCRLIQRDGRSVTGTMQGMWAGLKFRPVKDKVARLFVSAKDTVCAYLLTTESGKELVRGYCYHPSAVPDDSQAPPSWQVDMALPALIEGALWASRCTLKRLSIRTDITALIEFLDMDSENEAGGFGCAQLESHLRDIAHVNWSHAKRCDKRIKNCFVAAKRDKITRTIVDWANVNPFLHPPTMMGQCES